jgi:hypothetical protein
MSKIDVFKAANTTGIAINSRRITKTKPYGFVETVQSYDVNDDEILLSLDFDKTAILKKLDAIGMCINNVCNTGYTLQECDISFINEQIKHIEDTIK